MLAVFPGIVGVFTGEWWRYYGFLQLYSYDTVGGGIPVAWSLCVEVTFYLLLPVWGYALRRLTDGLDAIRALRLELAALGVVAIAGAGVQVAAARGVVSDLVASSLLGQSVWLALGMSLALLSVAADSRPLAIARWATSHPGLCWWGALGALCGLVAVLKPQGLTGIIQSLNTRQSVAETVAVLLLTAMLVALVVLPAVFGEDAGGAPRRLLAWRPVAWLGLVSYGLFLWHLPVAGWLGFAAAPGQFSASGLDLAGRLGDAATPVLLLLTLALSSVLAALSYYLVELPFLRRKG